MHWAAARGSAPLVQTLHNSAPGHVADAERNASSTPRTGPSTWPAARQAPAGKRRCRAERRAKQLAADGGGCGPAAAARARHQQQSSSVPIEFAVLAVTSVEAAMATVAGRRRGCRSATCRP